MTRTKVDSSMERTLLIAMVTCKPFLSAMAPVLDASLLNDDCTRVVAEWCVDYFKKYGEAPGKEIEAVYHAWVENDSPPETLSDDVHDLLEYLSEESETAETNVPHLLDEAQKYLSKKSLERLKLTIEGNVATGKIEEAMQAVQSFRSVSVNETIGYDPMRSKAAIRRAFAEPVEPIIKFPKDSGGFFDQALTRDTLIAIQGPEKRGKTYWCLEMMYRAVRNRKRVALFEVGDLSESQLTRRFAMQISEVPMWRKQCKDVKRPRGIELVETNEGVKAKVDFETVSFNEPLNEVISRKAQKAFYRKYSLSDERPTIMFSVHANSSINVFGINSILKRWQYEKNFVPDVIIIDYADILAPENPRLEHRHQINETWKALRRLSQEWHACVLAPTQADAASYEAKTQKMGNFSEDKRKLSHVTGMLGLNQTREEKLIGVMRLNWLVLRESDFHDSHCLWVAQCPPLGKAYVCATL